MKRFCTTSDINFLHRGLSLYESLNRHNDDFELFYLCSDDESYQKLKELDLARIVPVSLGDLFKTDVLDLDDTDDVLYIDPDIYFYHDWNVIFEEIGSKSIGIVRHRIPYSAAVGEFNVGIVYFKKDLSGYSCSTFWKDCLLDIENKYYNTHGMCGDQKYLELFAPLSGEDNVCVIDKKVGHLAPWNLAYHRYTDNSIIWEQNVQPLVYYHYSDFKANYEENYYEIGPRHGFTRDTTPQMPPLIQRACSEYFESLKKTKEMIK